MISRTIPPDLSLTNWIYQVILPLVIQVRTATPASYSSPQYFSKIRAYCQSSVSSGNS